MRRGTWAALAALFICGTVWGQGAQITNDILRPTAAIPGASIKFCTEGAAGTCPALANVYTDRALTTLDADSIIVADSRGSFTGYVAPGCYNLQISAAGFTTLTKTVCAPVIDCAPTLNGVITVGCGKYTTIAAAYAAASNGDVIFIPRGNYSVALDTLTISKPVRFVCASPKASVITFTGASGVAFKFNYDSNAPTGSYLDWGVGIENCQIIGPGGINGGASNAGTGIQLGDSTHSAIGAYFRNVIIAGFDIGTTWTQGTGAVASWGTKFDHVTWLNNDQQVLFDYSAAGTGLAHIEFVHPTFNHYQSGVTVQANAVVFGGTIGAEFNLIDPYFQSDQLVVSNNRVKLVNPTFENTNGQATTTYVSHTGGHLEMINPHFLQTSAGATVPTAYVTSSAGHLGMVNPGGNNTSATTFPVIALSGSVNVDIYGFRSFTNSSALFSGSTTGYTNAPNPSTGRGQFSGNDLMDINSTQTVQGKTFSDQIISSLATGTAPFSIASTTVVPNLNVSQLLGATWASPPAIGSGTPAAGTFTALTGTMLNTASNCSSAASPAVCSAAAAGSVVVAAAATTVVVNTTAITANSQVTLTFDSSLGTKLGVTCNTTYVDSWVSARTAATSFTITVAGAPAANPACFSYKIVN